MVYILNDKWCVVIFVHQYALYNKVTDKLASINLRDNIFTV
jgi:hypothetical protein